jgi:hypothetical protein
VIQNAYYDTFDDHVLYMNDGINDGMNDMNGVMNDMNVSSDQSKTFEILKIKVQQLRVSMYNSHFELCLV